MSSSSISVASDTANSMSSQTNNNNLTTTDVVPQSVVVQTSEVPPWVRLLTAPACCALLGLLLSPKFLVLAVIYALTSIRPLYCCYQQQQQQSSSKLSSSSSSKSCSSTNNNNNDEQQQKQLRQQVDAALALHRSMTIQFAMAAFSLWIYEKSRLMCMPKNNIDDNNNNSDDDSGLVVHQAFRMAKRIVHWEHSVGLAIEPHLQKFVMNSVYLSWIITITNTYYAILHFVAPVGVMARLIIYNKDPKWEYRLGFFIMLMFALFLFTFVPTMPPRLLPSYHAEYIETQQITLSDMDAQILEPYWSIVDTMKQGETLYDKLHKEGGNPYAAMPSMHTGWALWSCLTWIGTLQQQQDSTTTSDQRSRKIQTTLAISHVVFMIFTILVTGNHFWMDSAAGAICVLLGRFIAHYWIKCFFFCIEGNGCVGKFIRRNTPQLHSWLLVSVQQQPTGTSPSITKCDTDDIDYMYDEELTQGLTAASTSSSSSLRSSSNEEGSSSSTTTTNSSRSAYV